MHPIPSILSILITMKVLLLNPNSSIGLTEGMERVAKNTLAATVRIEHFVILHNIDIYRR